MSIYSITAQYRAFLEAVENGEIPEEAIADTLQGIEGEIIDKADDLACLVKGLEADAEAIAAEAVKLAQRKQRKLATAERIKRYLSEALKLAGVDKVETARNKITFRRSERLSVLDETQLKAWLACNPDYVRTKTVQEVDRDAVKRALKRDEQIPGVTIEERTNVIIG